MVATWVCEVVAALHYRVILTESSEAAMAVLNGDQHVDIMLTDIMMHGLNGIELAKLAMIRRPGLGVILSSGSPEEMFLIPEHCDFLGKPYSLGDLETALHRAECLTR